MGRDVGYVLDVLEQAAPESVGDGAGAVEDGFVEVDGDDAATEQRALFDDVEGVHGYGGGVCVGERLGEVVERG